MKISISIYMPYIKVFPYDSVISLAFTGGMRFPIARIGPGFMTMDLSIDWYQNDIPLSEPTPPFNGKTLKELVYGSAYAFKFGARLGYTFLIQYLFLITLFYNIYIDKYSSE